MLSIQNRVIAIKQLENTIVNVVFAVVLLNTSQSVLSQTATGETCLVSIFVDSPTSHCVIFYLFWSKSIPEFLPCFTDARNMQQTFTSIKHWDLTRLFSYFHKSASISHVSQRNEFWKKKLSLFPVFRISVAPQCRVCGLHRLFTVLLKYLGFISSAISLSKWTFCVSIVPVLVIV